MVASSFNSCWCSSAINTTNFCRSSMIFFPYKIFENLLRRCCWCSLPLTFIDPRQSKHQRFFPPCGSGVSEVFGWSPLKLRLPHPLSSTDDRQTFNELWNFLSVVLHRASIRLILLPCWRNFVVSSPMGWRFRYLENFVNFLVVTHFSWFLLGSRQPSSVNCFSWPSKAQMLQHKLCHCIFMAHSSPCYNQSSDTTL